MKSALGPELYDLAAWNTTQVEEVDTFDFEEMLYKDIVSAEWNKELEHEYFIDT